MAGSLSRIAIRGSLSYFMMKNYVTKYSMVWCQEVCCMVSNKSSSCCMMVSQVFFCLQAPKFFLWTPDFIETYQALSVYPIFTLSHLFQTYITSYFVNLIMYLLVLGNIFTMESKATVNFFSKGVSTSPLESCSVLHSDFVSYKMSPLFAALWAAWTNRKKRNSVLSLMDRKPQPQWNCQVCSLPATVFWNLVGKSTQSLLCDLWQAWPPQLAAELTLASRKRWGKLWLSTCLPEVLECHCTAVMFQFLWFLNL